MGSNLFPLDDVRDAGRSAVATEIPTARAGSGTAMDYHGIRHHGGRNLLAGRHALGIVCLFQGDRRAAGMYGHHFGSHPAVGQREDTQEGHHLI